MYNLCSRAGLLYDAKNAKSEDHLRWVCGFLSKFLAPYPKAAALFAEADDETAENLKKLMQGETVYSYVDTSVIYPEIKSNPTTIYSFLLSAGYLKTVNTESLYDGNSICDIAIPNKEIFYVYEKEILSALSDIIPPFTAISIQQAIIKQDIPKLQEHFPLLVFLLVFRQNI